MIQIQALSDSYDLLMAAAQKLNPHEKSFNMNYLQPLKKNFFFSHKCLIVHIIKCNASQLLRPHYNVLLIVPRCEIQCSTKEVSEDKHC